MKKTPNGEAQELIGMKAKQKVLFFSLSAILISGWFFVYYWPWSAPKQAFLPLPGSSISIGLGQAEGETSQAPKEIPIKTLLFTGDIMLDRGVEYFMEKNSFLYPFEKINHFLRWIDIVVGNLEGPIVAEPPRFPANSLEFAFSPEVVEGLTFANFNLLSLANNHTMNAKKSGLEQTRDFLREAKIDFVGEPVYCQENSLLEKEGVLFLAFNKTFPFNCSDEEIVETAVEARQTNPDNFLVVIFHWGEEYQEKSSLAQQGLAHQIIEAGANLIIGHHPHAAQEIEEYQGKLIFYSLGNFIFDQRFSQTVQQGLTVGLEIYPQKLIFRLFPVETYIQASLMPEKQKAEFLNELFLKSCGERAAPLCSQLKSGVIEIVR